MIIPRMSSWPLLPYWPLASQALRKAAPGAEMFETRNETELHAAAQRLARDVPRVVAIAGGDGTVTHTVTALGEALSVLRRETGYERVVLKGLDREHVGELLETIAAREIPEPFRNAIAEETEGNPFFIREILLHLVEAGKLHHQDGRWTSRYSVVARSGRPFLSVTICPSY